MINHGRTLLLNRAGATRPEPAFFLEEYVDPGFQKVGLNTALRTVYQAIIGDTADNAFANYRVWQYMRVLHSTEFESLLTDLDSRITYLNDRTLVDQAEVRKVEVANPEAGGIVGSIVGSASVGQACPRLVFGWEIRAITASLVIVTDPATRRESTEEVTFSDSISSLIPMVGQIGVSVRLQTGSLPIGAVWTVSLFADPPSDLADMIGALGSLSEEVLLGVFGTAQVEPYKTLRELWDKHNYFHYRLSAILLAHIYRVEELRTSGR